MVSASTCSSASTRQVSNGGAEQPRKQQRSDLNVPLENNNVPEVKMRIAPSLSATLCFVACVHARVENMQNECHQEIILFVAQLFKQNNVGLELG